MNARIALDNLDPLGGLGSRLPRHDEVVKACGSRHVLVNGANGVWQDLVTGRMETRRDLDHETNGLRPSDDRRARLRKGLHAFNYGARPDAKVNVKAYALAAALIRHNLHINANFNGFLAIAEEALKLWDAHGATCPQGVDTINISGIKVDGVETSVRLPADEFLRIVNPGVLEIGTGRGESVGVNLPPLTPQIAASCLRILNEELSASAGWASTFVNVEKAYEAPSTSKGVQKFIADGNAALKDEAAFQFDKAFYNLSNAT